MKAVYAEGAVCRLCPHHCRIPEGKTGLCLVRRNEGGTLIAEGYGRVTALALDPIEKKPLRHFHPGATVLSIGGYGCNMRCPFCQNHDISMERASYREMGPDEVADASLDAADRGNIGLAYTYNEPTVNYEFLVDCATLVHDQGQKNVLVTNGMLDSAPWDALLPRIDAMNIDLKGYSPEYYRKLGGDRGTVLRNIESAVRAGVWVELTTLILPGENDSPEEMEAMCAHITALGPEIPLHISRYFPRYLAQKPATPVETVYALAGIARKHLRYVYTGNC